MDHKELLIGSIRSWKQCKPDLYFNKCCCQLLTTLKFMYRNSGMLRQNVEQCLPFLP